MSTPFTKEFSLAKDLAYKAGTKMKAAFTLDMKKDWKEDNSPVTETDTAINHMVIEEIKKAFPTHSILGEEETHQVEGSEYAWLCDPIDGTIPFSHGAPTFMFLLALVDQKDGQPVLGVMYDPMMDRFLHAIKGTGAFLNGQPIRVSDAKTCQSKCIEISYRDNIQGKPNLLRYALSKKGAKIINFNCVGYGQMLVACGEFVASIFGYSKPYDVAAAKIIIEEAGGKVTDMAGNTQRYDRQINGCIMTNGHLHDDLLTIIAKESRQLPTSFFQNS